MFKNAEHKANPEKYKASLYNHINYTSPDVERILKTDIQTRIFAGGDLRMRVFKIFFNRRKKHEGTERGGGQHGQSSKDSKQDSIDDMPWINKDRAREEDTIMHKNGLSAL